MGTDDFEPVIEINRESVPYVFGLDAAEFSRLLEKCEYSRVVEIDGQIAGYLFVLGKGLEYDGEEYNWFCETLSEDFLYIDQVAIARRWKGMGCGTKLYMDLVNYAVRNQKDVLACEISCEPLNEDSMAFHGKLGFRELSRIKARDTMVSLQIKRELYKTV